ncbi:MAG TPA: hypothetical protein VGP72_07730 [Planctomycetota bacterium]|jgi:hypothetical protein
MQFTVCFFQWATFNISAGLMPVRLSGIRFGGAFWIALRLAFGEVSDGSSGSK